MVSCRLSVNTKKCLFSVLGSPSRQLHKNNKMMEIIEEQTISKMCRQLPPPLLEGRRKGQAGRIGVIGGSLEYTGAPFFAGISALKVGADLSHVICMKDAATVIKSYSPELIVHPLLEVNSLKSVVRWIENFHVVVIGPGLGREAETLQVVADVIIECRQMQKPLVIDADGLYLITQRPQLIHNYPAHVILTPNAVEFARLFGDVDSTQNLLNRFGPKCTVVQKGNTDEIFNTQYKVICSVAGSGRRCGGQGDLLSGSLATFLCWAVNPDFCLIKEDLKVFVACYSACNLTRACNAKAFAKYGRSMTCSDMIHEIGPIFSDLFETR